MTHVVLDTNVLVSALLSPQGAPAQVLRFVLADRIRLCVDERILNEYYNVLTRSRFAFSVSDVNNVLIFIEAALAAGADFLVTGNLKYFSGLLAHGVRVVSPKCFLDFELNRSDSEG